MLASRSCTHVLLQANVMQVTRAQHTLRITNHDYLHLMGLVGIFAREEKRRKHTQVGFQIVKNENDFVLFI